MIALIGLIIVGAYIISTILIFLLVRRKIETNKRRNSIIVIAIAILLPFWDMLLHKPIYWMLSSTVPEIERYQPYEKVDGFYEDYIPNGNIAFNMFFHNTFEKNYSIYFDRLGKYNRRSMHKEKLYFKAFWLNNSASSTCFPSRPSTVKDEYDNLIKDNWCISVKQIDKSEVSKFWELSTNEVFHFPLLYMNIHVIEFYVFNRHTGEKFFRLRDVYVDKSWMTAINFVSGEKDIKSGTNYTYTQDGKYFRFPDYKILEILDSKELPDI